MIPLESEKWSELRHAYGSATDIPELLKAVYSNPYAYARESAQEGVWHQLWGCLCHQGDIGSASFAAVPHLVEAALTAKPGILAWSIVHLPVDIECSRITRLVMFKRPGHSQPEEIGSDYFDAIVRLEEVCTKIAEWGTDMDLSRSVRAVHQLLSKRRGEILPKQRSDFGPLF